MKALLSAHDAWKSWKKALLCQKNRATLTATQKEILKDLKKKENKVKYLIFQPLYEDAFE